MEPEVQKLAVSALVGLMLLFPVFNQVQATSLEALRDADHKAKFKDFIKDWDDIPEDEKLSYWDGRNKPPGSEGDFDRGDVDDDARIHQPDDGEPVGDRDGDGTPDDQDPEPDNPAVNDHGRKRWVTEVLWEFQGGDARVTKTESLGQPGQYYEFLNATYSYSGFNGKASFDLKADNQVIWNLREELGGTYRVGAADSGSEFTQQTQAAVLTMEFDYDPLSAPDQFIVTIEGAYSEFVPSSEA